MTPSTPATTKAERQPSVAPIHAPTGAAQTVATETPVRIMAMARGILSSGTSLSASAADMAQKPPRPMPSRTREANSMKRPFAKAAKVLEMISSVVSPSNVQRRSMLRVPMTTPGPATAATSAVTVMDWPAMPELTARSAESGVSRLTGRNSAVTSPKTPSESETTAAHFASGSVLRGTYSSSFMVRLLMKIS
ncbi:hypothetical protein D3C86_1435240 [compost metagenome]